MKKLVRIFSATANLQEHPGEQSHIGRRDSQLLHGEEFEIESILDGWAYGRSKLDGYTGHLPLAAIDSRPIRTTHAISTILTNIYPAPDFKTHPSLALSFMSRVAIDSTKKRNGFVGLEGALDLWVPESHVISLKKLKKNPADIVETAQMFSGTPYIYGGRSAHGIDCSGLIQVALQRNGIPCPRDADQQQNVIGSAVLRKDIQRGDIVYFPGHVGIMIDADNILNATVRHMRVVTEPLDEILEHYGDPQKAILAIRRLTP